MKHPNAVAAFITTSIAAGLDHLATRYHWVSFSAEDALTIAGGAVTVVLFVGQRGLIPTVQDIMGWVRHGVAGAATPSPAAVQPDAAPIDEPPAGTVDPDAPAAVAAAPVA